MTKLEDQAKEIATLKAEMEDIQQRLEFCVRIEEFRPVRALVYGGVALVLTAAALAVVGLILKQPL